MDSYDNPKPGKTYISPRLDAFGQPDQKVRIASKLIEGETYAFAKIKDELVLRHHENAATNITAKFFEDDRGIFVLSIQGCTVATEKPHNASFSFIGEEIPKILEFIENIQSVNLDSPRAINISDDDLRNMVLSERQARSLLNDNEELFMEVIRSAITKNDVVAVGYRKRQLEVFDKLLSDDNYFEELKKKKRCSTESLWQAFFEKNPWIFGYGLSYVYLSTLDDKKLEQIVKGYSVSGHGKRADGLLKSRGAISSLCFLEIKTHKTELLEAKPYRSGCWAPSKELAGAISQVQGTVASAVENFRTKLEISDPDGFPTGEMAFNYMPKSYLIVGSLSEFVGEHGISHEKLRSFELCRRNIVSPEIITFDELFERARFIANVSSPSPWTYGK